MTPGQILNLQTEVLMERTARVLAEAQRDAVKAIRDTLAVELNAAKQEIVAARTELEELKRSTKGTT